jgi:predicted nucleic acid-binding protein
MAVLIDTNVLLRLLQPAHPHSLLAERAVALLRSRNESVNIVSQSIVEFWAVVTRPVGENGLGFTTQQALAEVDVLRRLFVLLPEAPLHSEWEKLVMTNRVSGKSTHDARLVAAMSVHGIGAILTFNTADFTRYAGITVLDPRTLV